MADGRAVRLAAVSGQIAPQKESAANGQQAVRIVYAGAHSILEHDEVKLFHELGHDVFSIGTYIHPSRPDDPKRPAIDVPEIPDLIAAVDGLGQQGYADTLMAAKNMGLPDDVLDWAEVIIIAALEHQWLVPHWDRFQGKRVIWRTIGQAGDANEARMADVRRQGCEIVRYSPREANIPGYLGADAVIRFYKDPAEWCGWTGEDAVVTNVTQSMVMRDPWCNAAFWVEATRGLPVRPMGDHSEEIGGIGRVDFEQMKAQLRTSRAYLYTGTQPASYTLGLIEAMMTGIPVVSIGPSWMGILPYGPQLFEGDAIAPLASDRPDVARSYLRRMLVDDDYATAVSVAGQAAALAMFGRATIAPQWAAYLDGAPVPQQERELVAA